MTTEAKSFFKRYWQAIAIAVSINVVIGVFTNIGAYKVVMYKMNQDHNKNIIQDQSIFELQINQNTLANKTETLLPYNYTMCRGNE